MRARLLLLAALAAGLDASADAGRVAPTNAMAVGDDPPFVRGASGAEFAAGRVLVTRKSATGALSWGTIPVAAPPDPVAAPRDAAAAVERAVADIKALAGQPGATYNGVDVSDVIIAEPDAKQSAVAESMPYGISKIQAPQAQTAGAMGTTVPVCSVDTGLYYLHEDLSARASSSRMYYTISLKNNAVGDDNGHGTHTSGTIAATAGNAVGVVGVAPQVELSACKFLSSTGSGSTSNAITCINWCSATQSNGKPRTWLSNHSWGGGSSSSLQAAIQDAGTRGHLTVFAAGNDGSGALAYPAAYGLDNMISVAATDSNDNLASWSNYGTWVSLAAPGVNTLSTWIGSTSAYNTISGTSMSTPHVTGAAAAVWSVYPTKTYAEIKAAIIDGATPKSSLQGKTSGCGRLNVCGALAKLGSTPTCSSPETSSYTCGASSGTGTGTGTSTCSRCVTSCTSDLQCASCGQRCLTCVGGGPSRQACA